MSNFVTVSQEWEKQMSNVQSRLGKVTSVMERSEEHRQKKELNELLDRGLSIGEKYGGERGWRLLLRHNENRKDEVF